MREHEVSEEQRRLDALEGFRIIDTPPEEAFDEIVRLAAEICAAPQAVMALVDGRRQWFKAKVGIDLEETPRDIAFCARTVESRRLLVVRDTQEDARFASNPLVRAGPRIRFYAGFPLIDVDGHAIGSLAVMDVVPRELDEGQQRALEVLTRQLMAQLELRRANLRLARSDASLHSEQHSLERRVEERTRELQRANSALRRAETLYGALWRTTTDAVLVIDAGSTIRYANPAAARLFGYEESALVGGPLSKVQPARLTHAHDAGLERYVATGRKHINWRGTEALAMNSAAVEIPVEIAFSEFELEGERLFVGFIRDIRVRKQVEDALREEKERAQTILGAIADAVIAMDESGCISYMNPLALRLTGLSEAESVGRDVADAIRIHDEVTGAQFRWPGNSTDGNTSATMSSAALLAHPDGSAIPVEGSLTTMSTGGEIVGYVAVMRDVSLSRRLSAQIAHQARHDPLTGLANRSEFDRRLREALECAAAGNVPHSMLYLDLDQFKIVNDTCGHVAGDELLKQLSVLLSTHVRTSDTLARLGGDEFGILLEGCEEGPAAKIAEKLRESIEGVRFSWKDQTFVTTVSVGLIHFSDDSLTFNDILSKADEACYMAKEHGRNRVHAYQSTDEALARRHGEMEWVRRVQAAIAEDRLVLFSQPIFEVGRGGTPTHAEVLLRMRDVDGGLVPPMAFIPAAERYNLMPAIDRWVVQRVLDCLQRGARTHLPESAGVAINISAASLTDPTFADFVCLALRDSAVAPARICFEVTETAAISNLSSAVSFMNQLRDLGCLFSLDDFGSGMSSFAYLRHLPVDYVKIDGAFIRDIATDPVARSIVEAVHQVARVMGLRTIAECVESPDVLEELRSLGVDFAQGFGLARPAPFE